MISVILMQTIQQSTRGFITGCITHIFEDCPTAISMSLTQLYRNIEVSDRQGNHGSQIKSFTQFIKPSASQTWVPSISPLHGLMESP